MLINYVLLLYYISVENPTQSLKLGDKTYGLNWNQKKLQIIMKYVGGSMAWKLQLE